MAPTIFGDLSVPPIARLLGWKLIAIDLRAGTIEVEFTAKIEFTNPSGFIQGGFLAAMLDDTLGPAAFALTEGKRIMTTIAFLEGQLFGLEGKLSAVVTASAILTDYAPDRP